MAMYRTLTFEDYRALTVYSSMAEGMEENALDNEEPEAAASLKSLVELIEGVPETAVFPWSLPLPVDLEVSAENVLENCLDNSSGYKPDDKDAEGFLFEGQVVLSPAPQTMPARRALELAMAALQRGTPSQVKLDARAMIERMLLQQGCEHFDPAAPSLCDLIDVIVYG